MAMYVSKSQQSPGLASSDPQFALRASLCVVALLGLSTDDLNLLCGRQWKVSAATVDLITIVLQIHVAS